MTTKQAQKRAKKRRQATNKVNRFEHLRRCRMAELEREDSPLDRWQLAQLKKQIAREQERQALRNFL